MLYAFDCDDVLLLLNDPLQEHKVELDRAKGINDTKVLSLEEVYDYDLGKVWNCSRNEAVEIVDDFFNSGAFYKMQPVPWAQEVAAELDERGDDLLIITSRREWLQQITFEQIDKYYPGVFSDIVFSGEQSKNPILSKKDICRDLGVDRLVDDCLKYCNDTARFVEKVYLFDLDGRFGWNKKKGLILPDNVSRILSLREILTI